MSKPTLVLIAAVVACGVMSASWLFENLIVAKMTSEISSPEFVDQGQHRTEMQFVFLAFLAGFMYSLMAAVSNWLG